MSLSWSLIIATLNRREVLLDSLKFNIRQTRPASQVIVVDASADWQSTRDEVIRLAESHSIDLIFLRSDERSLTRQRNAGLAHSTSDISFFLDDDSYMHHDCAEHIMAVYEHDLSGSIGGVCAVLSPHPEMERTTREAAANRKTLKELVVNTLERQWYPEKLFLPYDKKYHLRPLPPGICAATPVSYFHGCRMTFRTSAVKACGGFEKMLIRSSIGEDIDISYRVSRNFCLAIAHDAKLHHVQSPINRDARERGALLVVLNTVALYFLNASAKPALVRVALFVCRRIFWETVRGFLRPKNRFLNLRGTIRAVRLIPHVASMRGPAFRSKYEQLQKSIYQA